MAKFAHKASTGRIALVIVGLLSLLGGAVVVYSTAPGPWGYSDSVAYIVSARNLLKGIGLGYYYPSGQFYIQTHYPPFYPLMLAGIGLLRVDLVIAARWLSILLFVATLFCAGWIFLRYSTSSWLSILASVLIGIFPTTLKMFSSAMSEPLFVFLFILSGFSLVRYFRYNNSRWLIVAALLTGLLPLTRYIGIANVGAAAVCVLLFSSGRWKVRFGKAALFGLIASLPILLWVIWVYFSVDRSLAGRGFGVNGAMLSTSFMEFRAAFLNTIWLWLPFGKYLIPIRSRLRILSLILAAIGIVIATLLAERHVRRRNLQPASSGNLQVFSVFSLSSLAYVTALALTYLFTRPTPDVDNRMLLPLYAGVVMSMLAAVSSWENAWLRERRRWLRVIPWLVAAVFVYWHSSDAIWLVKYYHQGWGNTLYSWKNSETIQAVQNLPADVPVISDNAALLLLWADRPAYEMLDSLPPDFVDQTGPYGADESDQAQVVFRRQGAALVLFKGHSSNRPISGRIAGDYGEKGLARLRTLVAGLILCGDYADGSIYFYAK